MNIYVGNLPWSTQNEELEKLFQKFGKVTAARVIRDRFTGKSRGFGFVEMADTAEAEQAITELDGKEFNGRPLRVNQARERKNRR